MKYVRFVIFSMFLSFVAASAKSQTNTEALQFVLGGDTGNPLVKEVSFQGCSSTVVIDTLIFGEMELHTDWNNIIWNSKTFAVKENGSRVVRFSCKTPCTKYGGKAGEMMSELMKSGLGVLLGGDFERLVELDIGSTVPRINRALAVIQKSCPGIASRF